MTKDWRQQDTVFKGHAWHEVIASTHWVMQSHCGSSPFLAGHSENTSSGSLWEGNHLIKKRKKMMLFLMMPQPD